MGQKTNPISNRLGIIRGWDSEWYDIKNYSDKIVEDDKIRKIIHRPRLPRLIAQAEPRHIELNHAIPVFHGSRHSVIRGEGGSPPLQDDQRIRTFSCYFMKIADRTEGAMNSSMTMILAAIRLMIAPM